MADWRELLEHAVAETNPGAVAAALGVSRTYVSRVRSGHLDPVPAAFVRRVRATYDLVDCPATGRAQPATDCRRYATEIAPTHNPRSLRIWRHCQTCPNHPERLLRGR